MGSEMCIRDSVSTMTRRSSCLRSLTRFQRCKRSTGLTPIFLTNEHLQVLQQGVETLRAEISCFNMGSILIKPVQRILKYPLILNELLKCTEEEDEDKKDLREAVTLMSDVAAFINETKRKKDIVEKYKSEEETTLSRKISKLSIHSIGKKSSRMSQKLLTSLGMDSMVRSGE